MGCQLGEKSLIMIGISCSWFIFTQTCNSTRHQTIQSKIVTQLIFINDAWCAIKIFDMGKWLKGVNVCKF